MKRIIGVCLSLSALLLLGASYSANSTTPHEAEVFIQGATLVRPITDAPILEAVRDEYLTEIFAAHRPVTVEAVQVEEFEGRQYMTVLAKDKDGLCVSSSRDYAPSDGLGGAASEPTKNHCISRNCTVCSATYSNGAFMGCADCSKANNAESPAWCDHYLIN